MPRMEEVDESVVEKKSSVKKPAIKAQEIKEPNVWEIEGLPSRGKMYPDGTKLFGRPLKVVEVKKLSSMTDVNANYVVNDVIKRSITGINVDDLLIADKLFLIFWLRANTYRENGFLIDFECQHCKEKGEFNFTLNNLDVTYLPDDWSDDQMTFSIPNGDELTIHLLTVAEEQYATKFKISYENILKEIDDEILSVALMINSINGKEESLLDRYNYVISDKVGPQNYAYIVSYIKQYDCGVTNVLKVKCEKCGGDSLTAISFREEFFLPEYKIK